MSHADQDHPQVELSPTDPPPPAGYPSKEDTAEAPQGNAPPAETTSRGDGFLKGCCAAICCCCVLDACF